MAFTRPHINISALKTTHEYTGSGPGRGGNARDRVQHGRRVQQELAAALNAMDAVRQDNPQWADASGSYLEVELRPGAKADILDLKSSRVRSGATNLDQESARLVALYVPDGARDVLNELVMDYLTGPLTDAGHPPNKPKIEAIEAFRAARMETLWTDDPTTLPQDDVDQIWWGLWCWRDSVEQVVGACNRLQLNVSHTDRWLFFPEITVVPVYASRSSIEIVAYGTGGVSELRRASDNPSFYISEVRGDQHLWVNDMAERVTWPDGNAPAVCLLDTGVNRAHVLIEPALSPNDLHTAKPDWGVDDHDDHGTEIAGLALHGNLTAPLGDNSIRQLRHRLESVKLFPPDGFDPNEPAAYGSITQSAIVRPEITQPNRPRVYCLTITNDDVTGARPTAWSAAIDQAAKGTMPGDDEDAPKRLILIAAGNVKTEIQADRVRPQEDCPIEDPAQAWNALTIGGFTELTDIQDPGFEDYTPVAGVGQLSPHSRTSVSWPRNSPFKPELVFEAGNRAISANGAEVYTLHSLSLCTTGRDVLAFPIVTTHATSAATAQAARLAAQLMTDHEDYWPETIRGLMVHSAEWTPQMLAELGESPNKEDRYRLIRKFGYGVPSYERATASSEHHLALITQTEITPFMLRQGRRFNECHYHTLPIPRGMLERLENTEVQLKITLSYFIDPNPGASSSVDPQRYQSHGLRFDLRRKNERMDIFKRRVNASERENPRVPPESAPDDDRWMLGPKSVSAGSLHCDTWTGPAIELVGRDTLCIKPVGGWCKDRSSPAVCNKQHRYALVITLKVADERIDLYTPIEQQLETLLNVENQVAIETSVSQSDLF